MRLLLLFLLIPSMAFAFTDTGENDVLDVYLGDQTYYLGLLSATCSDSAAGTELSGNGYARQSITWASAASAQKANSNTITFTASGGDWSAATHFGIYDASSSGNQVVCGQLNASITVTNGASETFSAGQLYVGVE